MRMPSQSWLTMQVRRVGRLGDAGWGTELTVSRSDLRQKLRVNLVNAQGLDEPGIDGGGVFREFLSELLKTGFDPNYGFFTTTQDGLIYPNPLVGLCVGTGVSMLANPCVSLLQSHLLSEDFRTHYHFLGGMLGKVR